MSYNPLLQNGSINASVFSIEDSVDPTKKLAFDVSFISTGLVRSIIMPDFDISLADIYAHASRHLPAGADPIPTDTVVDIGTSNSPGVANFLVRSDHVHKGLHSINANAGAQRFGDVSLVNGANILITDDGSGNFTIAASGLGTGSVTSVALSLPSFIAVSGSPITTSGTLTGTLVSQVANAVFAAPDGAPGAPSFRALVAADIPTLNQNTTGTASNVTGIVALINGGTGVAAASANAAFNALSPMTTIGDIIFGGVAGAGTRLGIGSAGQVLTVSGGNPVWAAPATNGTVTSVALSLPSFITVTGSPVTTSGTLTGTLASQAANTVFAAPNGAAGAPTFRSIVIGDVPTGAPSTQTPDQANATGVSANLARADHVHQLVTAAAVSTSTVNGQGVSTSFARADHTHNTVIVNAEVSSNTGFATGSGTDVVITSFTTTPAAGTYAVFVSADGQFDSNNRVSTISIYVGGVQSTNTERSANHFDQTRQVKIGTQRIVTVNGSQAIDARVRVSGGNITIGNRSLIVIRLG